MNLYKNVSLYIIILLLIGCGNKSNNNYLAGYMSPGDFCSKGLAREKAYRFINVPNLPAPASVRNECSSTSPIAGNGICAAVHCIWYMSQSVTSFNNSLPTEGIAINDKHLPQPTFNLKISRVIGTSWYIEMVINGVKYSASTDQILLTPFQSVDFTDQTWNETECVASTTHINLIFVEFQSDIKLYSIPGDDSTSITIIQTAPGHGPTNLPGVGDGDYIVAQDYGI